MERLLSRRDSLLEECLSFDEECLDEPDLDEECLSLDEELDLEELLVPEDFSDGTSRMFKTRPVVGSVVGS